VSEVLARLDGIERRFGSVVALDGADLILRAGEVHGLLGANGAGKTTLLNVIGGMLRPDAGTIEVGGSVVSFQTPREAWTCGIALAHQHFALVPAQSVLENLALGLARGWADPVRDVRAKALKLMDRIGLRVPLDSRVDHLGVGDKQRLEILKALLKNPRVLVLDEPTAVLAPNEISGLFALLRELAAEGRAVVLVAHKLDEVLMVADRLTVLRAGRTVLSTVPGDYEIPDLVRAMVGADPVDAIAIGVDVEPRSTKREPGESVAHLDRVSVTGGPGVDLEEVSLHVYRGQVVGVAGVEGNGQRSLALLLAGRVSATRGSVTLPEGLGFIPQDRSTEGLIAAFDLTDNVALALHRVAAYQDGPWLRWSELTRHAETIHERFEVQATSTSVLAGSLSGGNQQRVVVGRELSIATDLLIAENPTRGLDVAAAAFVHDEIRRLVATGVGVVLVSTDLDEVLALSDRVFAMTRGRLLEVDEGQRSREGVGALMLGGAFAHA